jgi:hypothetical protein
MVVQEIAPASSLTARLHRLVVTVDHKQLGLMYIATALLFLLVAGSMAAVIRAQLAVPNNGLITASVQPPVHHARHDDGLSGGHADAADDELPHPLMIGARTASRA